MRNAYLDAALAVVAVKDAAKALSDAKGAYSQAQRDHAAGKITKEAFDDSKANGERIETTTAENAVQGQWQGSNLDLNSLTLKSGCEYSRQPFICIRHNNIRWNKRSKCDR